MTKPCQPHIIGMESPKSDEQLRETRRMLEIVQRQRKILTDLAGGDDFQKTYGYCIYHPIEAEAQRIGEAAGIVYTRSTARPT